MEILLAVIIIVLLGYWMYTTSTKEKTNEPYVLDTLAKPVEVAPPVPVAEPVKVEAVAPMAKATAVKKPRAPAKPRAKKTPAP